MRIFNCLQNSEEWDRLRSGRPTASKFGCIVTPAKGQYSTQSVGYACELIAQRLGVYTEPPPSFWMEWGTEHEPIAVTAYEAITGRTTQTVGFVTPDDTDAFGGSPDRFIMDDGEPIRLLEVNCPKPETLLGYHIEGKLPDQYRAQVQGLLWITGLQVADFFAWHPELSPFLLEVERDEAYITAISKAMAKFLGELARMEQLVKRHDHIAALFGGNPDG